MKSVASKIVTSHPTSHTVYLCSSTTHNSIEQNQGAVALLHDTIIIVLPWKICYVLPAGLISGRIHIPLPHLAKTRSITSTACIAFTCTSHLGGLREHGSMHVAARAWTETEGRVWISLLCDVRCCEMMPHELSAGW